MPLLADKLVRGFTPQALESFAVVGGQQKDLHMVVELGRGLVMIALHGGPFERAVEALDLSVGQGWAGLVKRCSVPCSSHTRSKMSRQA